MKIIECVPNFSEGRNEATLTKLKDAINLTGGVKLLNFEPDGDYNRVVVTFAGDDTSVLNAAVNICKVAAAEIDMTQHKGEHPRLGAIDVVPFIPVKDATMEECVKLSEEFGKRISEEINIPVYLYEASAKKQDRINLSSIRKGEYEGLAEKLTDPNWMPDFGKPEHNAKTGALVTGARFFLVAYNVNIESSDIGFSKEIAETLRESGKPKRDEFGKIIKVDGKNVVIPGKLKSCKGMGVALEKYGITQVSMNLTNYNITPIHVAFEEVKQEAKRLGVKVNGSEIVGLVPLEALLMAGKFYANDNSLPEEKLVDIAIENLGLSTLNKFEKNSKIIDYMI